MRLLRKALIAAALLCVMAPVAARAQVSTTSQDAALAVERDVFLRGTVTERQTRHIEGLDDVSELKVRIDSGHDAGKEVGVTLGGAFADSDTGLAVGDGVVVVEQRMGDEVAYAIADRYRLPWVIGAIAFLLAAAIVVGGKRGVTATFGLAASVAILAFIVIPQLAGGYNPVLVAFLGAVAIGTVSTLITHGASRETGLVIASILCALTLGAIAALAATAALQLSGLGSEEAVSLTYGPLANIDLGGLLVAGVILGCLGVLDDVAATQVAAVKEIAEANPRFTRRQLYRRGMHIGAEHVAALINTLFLAYAGASLPLLLVGRVNLELPAWAFLNSESVVEELIRTVVGSAALILAVPIATMLAAWYFGARRGAPLPNSAQVV